MTHQLSTKVDSTASLDFKAWNSYVHSHPKGNVYQLSAWLRAIEDAYGHQAFFLSAYRYRHRPSGILPLVCMRGLAFKKELVSTPFCDLGGLIADDMGTEAALIRESIRFGKAKGIRRIEFRQSGPISSMETRSNSGCESGANFRTESRKVRMVLELPASSQKLFDSFRAKLRSQIRRPEKSNLYARLGGMDMLEDFYSVFVRNMRDLGSPVHSKGLIKAVLRNFEGKAKIVVVYKDSVPVAASILIGFRNLLANPWASALRKYGGFSPNMLLYWTMLRYGCDNGYQFFDFGRSTPGEGTYRFKKQWGAESVPVHWYSLRLRGDSRPEVPQGGYDSGRFDRIIELWKRMPVSWSRRLGPAIRRGIDL